MTHPVNHATCSLLTTTYPGRYGLPLLPSRGARYDTRSMATKLCCTAEQEGCPDSPELPNARITEAPTPAQLPLLPRSGEFTDSRFTSARTEDLHELQHIFNSAEQDEPTRTSPSKAPSRLRFDKPSMHSLRSMHKMKSMRSLIRRKFSKDLVVKPSGCQAPPLSIEAGKCVPDTVVKQPTGGPIPQLHFTKDDLKKNLLSDKRPDEGGYDSDAQMLDDIARNIGRRTPSKRPSIHSIEWTISTGR